MHRTSPHLNQLGCIVELVLARLDALPALPAPLQHLVAAHLRLLLLPATRHLLHRAGAAAIVATWQAVLLRCAHLGARCQLLVTRDRSLAPAHLVPCAVGAGSGAAAASQPTHVRGCVVARRRAVIPAHQPRLCRNLRLYSSSPATRAHPNSPHALPGGRLGAAPWPARHVVRTSVMPARLRGGSESC